MKTMTSRMRPNPGLANRIAKIERKLEALEDDLRHLNDPAGARLRERIEALKIEEKALKRNFHELSGECLHQEERLQQVERLLAHVQREESNVEHEAAFLSQSSPSSVTLAAEAGSKVITMLGKKFHKILGDRHPLGWSVFVNHTHDDLVTRHGLDDAPDHSDAAPVKFLNNLTKRTKTATK